MASSSSGSTWLVSLDELKNYTPSRASGMSFEEENAERMKYCRKIMDLGSKLDIAQLAKATALLFFHRFYLRQSFRENEPWIVGVTCLFLAAKVEETPKKLRDVVRVAYMLRFQRELRDDTVFNNFKEKILINERKVLQTIAFDLTVVHPYAPLLRMVKKVAGTNKLAQSAWNFINDSLGMTLCLRYKPEDIAAAAIVLASEDLGIDLITSLPQPWWDILDVPVVVVNSIKDELVEMYAKSGKPLQLKVRGARSAPPPSSGPAPGGSGAVAGSSSAAAAAAAASMHRGPQRPKAHDSSTHRHKPY